jgi:hypothetical protein
MADRPSRPLARDLLSLTAQDESRLCEPSGQARFSHAWLLDWLAERSRLLACWSSSHPVPSARQSKLILKDPGPDDPNHRTWDLKKSLPAPIGNVVWSEESLAMITLPAWSLLVTLTAGLLPTSMCVLHNSVIHHLQSF